MNRTLRIAVTLLATFGAGLVGSLFVDTSDSSWYASLIKPEHTPPDWAFVPIWLSMYTLMSISMIMVWVLARQTVTTDTWSRFYFLQLVLNAGWSMFFFGFHAIFLAMVEIGFLIFVVVCLMIAAWEFDKRVVALLTPYLAWIVYAGFLNALIWYLN